MPSPSRQKKLRIGDEEWTVKLVRKCPVGADGVEASAIVEPATKTIRIWSNHYASDIRIFFWHEFEHVRDYGATEEVIEERAEQYAHASEVLEELIEDME